MTKFFALSIFSLLHQTSVAFAAAGGVAPDFNFSHWADRIHIFWISLTLMTGGSIVYAVLLRRKKRKNES
jgi:uncharacterized BrkB/YihY/UPF0761 family membrane protein